jgi:hypothetical protein
MAGDEYREFKDLTLVEVLAQPVEDGVVDGCVIGREEFSVFDARLLRVGIQIAATELADLVIQFFAQDLPRARRSACTQSERAVVDHREPVAHQLAQAVGQLGPIYLVSKRLDRCAEFRAQGIHPLALRSLSFR